MSPTPNVNPYPDARTGPTGPAGPAGPPGPAGLPGQKQDTADAAQDFSNEYQTNAGVDTDMADAWKTNRKRTYDAYQHAELEAIRQNQRVYEQAAASLQAQLAAINNVSLQALQNAVKVSDKIHIDAANDTVSDRSMSRKHADVAANAMWDNALNPVTQGAGNDLTGQAPVNAALSSTASLDTVFTNLTAQVGEMVTAVVGLAQTIVQSNVQISANNAASIALMAQLVENAKQTATPSAAK
jgi:hypothetical protein